MSSFPLVSCVMPTWNRARFVPTAIRCFLQQFYENKELIIVDDGMQPLDIPNDSRIKYIQRDVRMTTGSKRNLGAQEASGEIIVNWDDDDFSASYRLEDQVQRLLKTGKAVTGYNATVNYDEVTGLFYKNTGGPPYYASGTSQCYRKEWWQKNPFPDCSFGEDSVFARTARLANELSIADVNKTMVARKHANNTAFVYVQKLKRLTTDDISSEFFATLNNQFLPAVRTEALLQFVSPIIDKDYKVNFLPEIQIR
jgi:glycosyltransferase involved in cell wall biosynthesis